MTTLHTIMAAVMMNAIEKANSSIKIIGIRAQIKTSRGKGRRGRQREAPPRDRGAPTLLPRADSSRSYDSYEPPGGCAGSVKGLRRAMAAPRPSAPHALGPWTRSSGHSSEETYDSEKRGIPVVKRAWLMTALYLFLPSVTTFSK